VLKHFKHPKNQGIMKNPSAVGEVGNIQCGDVMKLYLKIKKNEKGEKIISDIKFECLGCVVAIANTSLITTMVKGRTLKEAMKIEQRDILKKMGKVPITKVHCSVLAVDALSEAIYDYYKKDNFLVPRELEKKHKGIQQALKYVEKKHKGYIEFEEKIWGKK
jgi:nitrogen fixation NifU-like protein